MLKPGCGKHFGIIMQAFAPVHGLVPRRAAGTWGGANATPFSVGTLHLIGGGGACE